MKTALIVGSAGQDGQLLTAELVAHGWGVLGVDLGGVTQSVPLLPPFSELDLLDRAAVDACIDGLRPTAVFYLAALHHSSEESTNDDPPRLLEKSQEVHVVGWAHVLDALARLCPDARAFYAASSHVFGEPDAAVQNETTPLRPVSIYGITKVAGVELGRFYRQRGLHVSNGFLYNHESPLRAEKFVSQRIVRGAVQAALSAAIDAPFSLELGSLSAVVDWGWAPDYVRAMRLIVESETPNDYVVSTGIPHDIADFCRLAFAAVGLDSRDYVKERSGRLGRVVPPLVGDAARLRSATAWQPSVDFAAMVQLLVEAERARLRSAS